MKTFSDKSHDRKNKVLRYKSSHIAGCSGLVHWDDPGGWDEEGGGKGVQDGEHMYTHGKNHYNIVK